MSQNGNPTDIAMPQLAESLVSATIAKWLKQPGDSVDQYEPICEVITDKVNAEIPSVMEGTMGELLAAEGQEVAVGEIICRIYSEGAGEPAAPAVAPGEPAAEASHSAHTPATSAPASQPVAASSRPASGAASGMAGRYSPAVQSLAAQHELDLSLITGTGAGGRVTRRDVLKALENGTAQRGSAPATPPAPAAMATQANHADVAQPSSADYAVRNSGIHLSETPAIPKIELEQSENASGRGEHMIDVTPLRNAIARNMRQSVSEIPHAWTMIEVDVTNLVMLRNKLKDEFKRSEGITLTYLPFLIKAVVNAIKDYPIMNSVWAVDKIIVKRDINVSLAVGTEDSVMTPVIQRADQKNIAGLAHEIDDLARRTREGKLKLDDMQGGTFTVNNTGSFGSVLSYPIINYPQAAILTFESIVKRPVVINDMIGVRSMVNLCMSLDHRILDGVICGRFLQRVKDNLEGYGMDTKLY